MYLKNFLFIVLFCLITIPSTVFAADSANAQCIAELVDNWVYNARGYVDIIAIIAYVSGIGFGIKGVHKIKEHNESRGQVKLVTPIFMLVGAAFLLAMPTLMKMGIDSILGTDAEAVAFASDIQSRSCGSGGAVSEITSGNILNAFKSRAVAAASAGAMFEAFTPSAQKLFDFGPYVAWIIGVGLIIKAIFKFIELGNNPQVKASTPIVHFICGVGLIGLTTSIQVFADTMKVGSYKPESNPGYILAPGGGATGNPEAIMAGIFAFLMFVGMVAVIRGWLLLNQMALGKEGVLGKGLTHIFGGIALINLHVFAPLLARSIGW